MLVTFYDTFRWGCDWGVAVLAWLLAAVYYCQHHHSHPLKRLITFPRQQFSLLSHLLRRTSLFHPQCLRRVSFRPPPNRRRTPPATARALAELLRALVTPKWLIIMPVLPSSPSPWIGSRAFDHSICHAHKAIFISVMVTSAPHAVINTNNVRFTTVLGVSILHSAKVTKDRWHTTPP